MDEDRSLGHGVLGGEICWKDLVLHPDAFNGLLGGLPAHRRDGGHLMADIEDLFDGQCGLVLADRAIAGPRGEVLARDDGLDARRLLRVGDIDVQDARVGVRASKHAAVQKTGHVQIGREFGLAQRFDRRPQQGRA